MTPAYADDAQIAPSNPVFAYVIVGGVAVAIVIALATVRSSLSGANSTWSLSDALSEEADISPLDKDGKPLLGPDGKPQIVSELRASSSRFIALMGLIGIMMIYIGFGLIILQRFAGNGTLPTDPQIKDIVWFLFAGVTMFAPYIAQQILIYFRLAKTIKVKRGAPRPKTRRSNKSVASTDNLSKGMASMNILDLQKQLTALGFDPGPADGVMGPKTEAAIINFQAKSGLDADGIVGPETEAALGYKVDTPTGDAWTQMLDVSAYQGVVDFAKVKASGYPAVAIKATEGLRGADPGFRDRWQSAKAAGIVRFAYHFLHPNLDGGAQADLFLRTLGGDLGEIVPALDWETDGGVSVAQQTAQADAWYAKVDKVYADAGYKMKPFAYSYSSFFALLKLPASYATRPLWLAGYVAENRLTVPAPWKKYDIWQWAGDALSPPVDGIDPRLKKDYNKFHGTVDALRATYGNGK